MRRNGGNGALHDSHSFLMAAFSAAFFSAKEGSAARAMVGVDPSFSLSSQPKEITALEIFDHVFM